MHLLIGGGGKRVESTVNIKINTGSYHGHSGRGQAHLAFIFQDDYLQRFVAARAVVKREERVGSRWAHGSLTDSTIHMDMVMDMDMDET